MSRSLNRFEFIGHLGHDPELKYTADGNHRVARFNIATSIPVKNPDGTRSEKTDWHRIVLWDKLADIAQSFLHKGDRIYISGRIRNHSWTDSTTGDRKFGTEFMGDQLIMLTAKETTAENTATDYAEPVNSDEQPTGDPF